MAVGESIGAYRVLAKIGEGAMGEVYRAHDARLGRDVALKVLQPGLVADPEALARFEREARALATVPHPHIASIYGIEESGSTRALVMELVEGETLAARVARGALPIAEALRVAGQIASALEAAHERGVVHRDLKPANIQLTRGGDVKVLDFGLARLVETAGAAPGPGGDETGTAGWTRAGTILGTVAYMSPEQARGEPADRRSDIWAFGCTLYEVLSGRRAFGGATPVDALGAILEREPDWSRLPGSAPPALRRLLERCLRKDPRQRLQHAGDARIEIEEILGGAADLPPRSWRQPAWAVAMLVAALAIVGLTIGWILRPSPGLPAPGWSHVVRASLPLPPDLRLVPDWRSLVALSPDGTTLVFAAERDGRARLYLRRLDEFEQRPIPNTENGQDPFFSPDGEWIGFFAEGQLKRVAVTGGAAIPIVSVPTVIRGAAWHDDGTIIFASEAGFGLSRVSATGGPVQTLTTPDAAAGEMRHHWPHILPGGRVVLFTVFTGGQSDSLISVVSLDTGERKVVIPGGTRPFYVSDRGSSERGHIVYTHGEELLASAFDPGRLEVSGPPRRIAAGVRTGMAGGAQVAVSPDGTVVYVSGSPSEQKVLVWVDRGGIEKTLVGEPERFWFPRLSPDGTRLMVTRVSGDNFDVWIYDLAERRWENLTFDPAFDAAGAWSPDGQRVAFRSFREQPFSLFVKPSDGSAPEQRITDARSPQVVYAWTPDGRALVYEERDDLWIVPVEGRRTPKPLLSAPYRVMTGVPSPDGRWLAYVSEESGIPEVVVAEFRGDHLPAGGMRRQISIGGGVEPAWSSDGRELFYRGRESLMAVGVAPGTALKPTAPRALFPDRYERMGGFVNYGVAGDGQRFVMVKALDAPTVGIRIVTNALNQ